MRINVPPRYREGFWKWAPAGRYYWWFRKRPPCQVGDEIVFTQDRRPVATAIVADVSPPGEWDGWRIFWTAGSFEDVRDDDAEGFRPQLYGGYA